MPSRIIAALPVRNGENDLPGYFRSVSRFADGVVALDDGSTDRTLQVLEKEKLALEVLRNPRRDSFIGWDDRENRSRLLDACRKHKADWIFFLDADEVLDDGDALALRQFVETEAVPDVAYGVQMHRMIGDMDHFDKCALWNYRFFMSKPGQQLSTSRILHFEPIPTSIPCDRWIRTKFRIKHRSGLTEANRRARYEKYLLVDPKRLWQSSYENLLDPPGPIKQFKPFDPSGGYLIDHQLHERLAAEFRALSQTATQPPRRARFRFHYQELRGLWGKARVGSLWSRLTQRKAPDSF